MSSTLSRPPRPARPPRGRRAVRAVLTAAVLVVLAQLWAATPAAAHAELVGSTPGNGARLEGAPAEVTLTFTEHVTLINGGLRLLGPDGTDLTTPPPTVTGRTVHWPMPADLPDGRYLANWRLVSADGHPVSGAVGFGIGTAATAAVEPDTESSAPWPVISARYLGYLGFALSAGVLAFLMLCRPDERARRTGATMIRAGLVLGLAATLLSFLVQGPYVAGVSQANLLDPALLRETLATPFGVWLVWRAALYVTLVATSWRPAWLEPTYARWLVGGLVLAQAATFPGTGHGAASGTLTDRVVDGVHVLTAGVWVGGLAILAVLGRSTTAESVRRFSTLAATSVGLLVLTGSINSLLEIPRLSALWDSAYGRLLLVKLGLVGLALLAAAVSRRAVGDGGHPWRSVRVEAMAVVVVLAVTSTLALTTPPPSQAGVTVADATTAAPTATSVVMNLGEGRSADLHLSGLTVSGTDLHLILTDASGRPLAANRVELRASMPGRDIAAVEVPLEATPDGWQGRFRFPLQGVWKLVLTVEDQSLTAVVTAGEVAIRT